MHLFSSPWTSLTTTIQCFGLPAVLGFFCFFCTGEFTDNAQFNADIHIAVSDVHININYSKMDPFSQVLISTLVLRNVISAPCTPLPSIYIPWLNFWTTFPSLWWHPSKLTMTDICIQSILSAAGVPGYYIRHSFCIGTADLVEWVTKQKLECHRPDALSWWLLYSYPTGFSVSGQVCWLFFINLASPPSRQTRRAVDVPNNPGRWTGLS